jgi:excisionase family DNA binding protein
MNDAPEVSGGVLGAEAWHAPSLPDIADRAAAARSRCLPGRGHRHFRVVANGSPARHLVRGVRESAPRGERKVIQPSGSEMRSTHARTAEYVAHGVESSQELSDLLAIAGAERAERVLALLRELLLMPSPGGERPKLMTIEQVAKRLQVSTRTVRRAIEAGELDALDLPFRGGLRVTQEALQEWFASNAAVVQNAPVAIGARRSSGRLELSDL